VPFEVGTPHFFGQLHGGTHGVAIVTGGASRSGLEARFRFLILSRNDGEWHS
jgi:hypothetical protein